VQQLAFLLLILPLQAAAWEDAMVLDYIERVNPVIRTQRNITEAYRIPGTLQYLLENTQAYVRAGLGGTDFRDDPVTVYGGLQIAIPLASSKEKRELSLKLADQARSLADMRTNVLSGISALRLYESDRVAASIRMKFYKDRAAWLKKRMQDGYSDTEDLWTVGAKLNTEKASVEKLTILVASQRHKLSRYAGEHWPMLLDYLNGKIEELG